MKHVLIGCECSGVSHTLNLSRKPLKALLSVLNHVVSQALRKESEESYCNRLECLKVFEHRKQEAGE